MLEIFPYFWTLIVALSILAFRTMRYPSSGSLAVLSQGDGNLVSETHRGSNALNVRFRFADLIVIGILGSFMGLRKSVGTDWNLYYLVFQNLDPKSDWLAQIFVSSQEFGFTSLNLCLRYLGLQPVGLFLTLAFLTVAFTYLFLLGESKNLFLSLSLYVFLGHYLSAFNISRQSLATAIFALALYFLPRSRINFIFISLIATSIHLTAIIPAGVVILIYFLKLKTRSLIIFSAIAMTASFALLRIPVVVELAASLSPRYSNYLNNSTDSGIGSYLIALFIISLLTICSFLAVRHSVESIWLKIALLAPVFLVFGTQVVEMGRISFYFTLGLLIALPNLIARSKYNMALNMLIFILSSIFFVAFLVSFGDLLPYRTW